MMNKTNNECKLHEIKPEKDKKDYSDSAYSRIYSSIISMAIAETKLIWNRYSIFLIVEGLFIKVLFDGISSNQSNNGANTNFIYYILPLIGMFISIIWHILNYSGWLNHNLLYRNASQLYFSKISVPLITDQWRKANFLNPSKKYYSIYSLAQSLPKLFIFIYGIYPIVYMYTNNYLDLYICKIILYVCLIASSYFIIKKIQEKILIIKNEKNLKD